MQIQRNISHTVLPKKTAYQWFIEALSNHDSDECLLWPFAKTGSNYGSFRLHGKNISVHMAAYEEVHGPLDDGMWVLHKCDTPPCFNPRHLFAGTCQDNEIDKHLKRRGSYGENHHQKVLNEDLVREIRRRHDLGESAYALSKFFPTSKQTILSVIHRKTWKHVI